MQKIGWREARLWEWRGQHQSGQLSAQVVPPSETKEVTLCVSTHFMQSLVHTQSLARATEQMPTALTRG